MAGNPERLTCVSIILCDVVYRDERTKKLLIVGTFNRIAAPSVPCMHPHLEVLFTLTNGRGSYQLSLAIEHADTGEKVVEVSGPLSVQDPLAVRDINLILRNLEFRAAGKYWVVLRSDGEILSQRPFLVEVAAPDDEGKANEQS